MSAKNLPSKFKIPANILRQGSLALGSLCPPQRSVLEVGCGSGAFARENRELCSRYLGIAPSATTPPGLPTAFEFRAGDPVEGAMLSDQFELLVFLSASRWREADLAQIFSAASSRWLLFSYREAGAGFQLPFFRSGHQTYTQKKIFTFLKQAAYRPLQHSQAGLFSGERIVLAERTLPGPV